MSFPPGSGLLEEEGDSALARVVIVGIPHPLGRGRIPELCARVERALRERRAGLVLCDLSGATSPSAATVEALARVRLLARRHGSRFRALHPCDELRDLLALMGLDEVLLLEPGGQPEQREQGLGVQEEGDPTEPIP